MRNNKQYEELTIRMPRQIMDFLRQVETRLKVSPQEYIEASVIEMTNADREAL